MQLTNKDKKIVKKFIKYWIKRCRKDNEYLEQQIDKIIIDDIANLNYQQDPIMETFWYDDPWIFDSLIIEDEYNDQIIFKWNME